MPSIITKLAASPQQQGSVVPDAPFDLDVKLCTATYTVSSSAIDNDGDILIPEGSLPHLQRFTANPVVLWNHDRDCAPVAQSINPITKQLSWAVEGDRVKATAHFHLMTQESAQCWGLIENGILRGASVGFDAVLGKTERLQGKGIKFIEWIPLEWSVCPIPNNPETLLEAVNRQWDGKSLAPAIVKSLMAYVPKSTKVIVSMVQPRSYVKSGIPWVQSKQKASSAYGYCPTCNSPVVSRTRGGPNSKDTCSQGHMYPAKESKAMADEATTPTEEVKDDSPAHPPGAQAIMGFTADVESALANLNTALGAVENPDVLALFEQVGTAIEEQVQALRDGLSSIYPDLEVAVDDDGDADDVEVVEESKADGEEEKPEDKAKSIKKNSPADEYAPHLAAIQDAGDVIKEMSDSPNIPKSYRMACKGAYGGLMSACDYVSKSFASKAEEKPEVEEEVKETVDEKPELEEKDDEISEDETASIKSLVAELSSLRKEVKSVTGKVN